MGGRVKENTGLLGVRTWCGSEVRRMYVDAPMLNRGEGRHGPSYRSDMDVNIDDDDVFLGKYEYAWLRNLQRSALLHYLRACS